MGGSPTNLQQYNDGFGMQNRLFCQSIIVMELITDELKGFVNWYSSEKTDVKVNKSM
jgi:hypothetical protein